MGVVGAGAFSPASDAGDGGPFSWASNSGDGGASHL